MFACLHVNKFLHVVVVVRGALVDVEDGVLNGEVAVPERDLKQT